MFTNNCTLCHNEFQSLDYANMCPNCGAEVFGVYEPNGLPAEYCPICNACNYAMGVMGNIKHYNCRQCGIWYELDLGAQGE